jgi:TDG/mug DNA glycosylase family protein
VNRSRNAEVPPTLPDLLAPGLDLVFVGINPGETSARLGHYYANRGNAFWSLLSGSPLVSRGVGPEDDAALAHATPLRIGFTDVVKRVETDSSKVETFEIRDAAAGFRTRIALATPRAVCFTGARQFDVLFPGERGAWGHQPVDLDGAEVWVIPSTSGRAVAYRGEIAPILEDLAAALGVHRAEVAR